MSTFSTALAAVALSPVRTSARAFLPVSVNDAKKQLEITESVNRHDDQLTDLLTEAVDLVEVDTPYVAASAQYTVLLDGWPPGDEPIRLPRKPVSAITTIKYYDQDAAQITLSSALYRTSLVNRVWPSIWRVDLDDPWPDLESHRAEPIEIIFQAGHLTIAALRDDAVWMRQAALARMALLWHDRGLGRIDYAKANRVYASIVDRRRSSRYLT